MKKQKRACTLNGTAPHYLQDALKWPHLSGLWSTNRKMSQRIQSFLQPVSQVALMECEKEDLSSLESQDIQSIVNLHIQLLASTQQWREQQER